MDQQKASEKGVSAEVYCEQEQRVIGRYDGKEGIVTVAAFLKGYQPELPMYAYPVDPNGRVTGNMLKRDSQAICPHCKGGVKLLTAGMKPEDGVYLVPEQIALQAQ